MELARQAGLVPDLRNLPSPGTDRRLVGRGAGGEGVRLHPSPAHRVKQGRTDRQQYDKVHRAILTGLLSSLAHRGDGYEYTVAGGGKANLWPGSGIFQQKPKWLVAAEVVETTRRYLRHLWTDRRPLDRADRRAPREVLVPRRTLGACPRFRHGLGADHALWSDDRRRAADPLRAHRPGHVASFDDRTRLCRGPSRTEAGVPRAQRGAKAICWVNPNAFVAASVLGAGDAPIGNIIGPHFYQWDLSLRKTVDLPFREGMRLQFQADAFNAFNQANWNNPTVNNAGTASFGQITGSLPARVLQIGAKFNF